MSHIFDCPSDLQNARLIYLPIPWDATTSYGQGAANGPQAILKASVQLDLFDEELGKPYEHGLFLLDENPKLKTWNQEAKELVQTLRQKQKEVGGNGSQTTRLEYIQKLTQKINELGERCQAFVCEEVKKFLQEKKIVATLGGDHSVSFGAIKAHAEHFGEFGILHIDAHHDLRNAYEGLIHSHASIMYNVIKKIPQVTKLVQVGIRDFCEEEFLYAKKHKDRIAVFYDTQLQQNKLSGRLFSETVRDIVTNLPDTVYISLDIDGLDPRFCPNTGTPVPGGLDFCEVNFLVRELVKAGKKIIGFDLVEVAPGKDSEWDANVGMRLLYKLSGWTLASRGHTS